jgi:hypothetical protein
MQGEFSKENRFQNTVTKNLVRGISHIDARKTDSPVVAKRLGFQLAV